MRKINKKWVSISIFCIFLLINSQIVYATSFSINKNSNCVATQNESDDNRYAIIMVGRYFGLINHLVDRDTIQNFYTHYLNDAGWMYTVLKDTYGYDEDNIFLLVKLLPGFDIPSTFNPSWIDYSSSEENLEMVLNSLNGLKSSDSLLFCFINHGGTYGNGGIGWLSPDSHSDYSWKNKPNAYDDDKSTSAKYNEQSNGYSQSLSLKLSKAQSVKGFRISANNNEYFDELQLQFLNNGYLSIDPISFNKWPDGGWKHYRFNECIVDEVRIIFHENHPYFGYSAFPAEVYEFDFWPGNDWDDLVDVYFGCPLDSIPDIWKYLFGNDVERLHDYELAEYVSDINARMIFLLQPCSSGGFINDLSGDNRIICTACMGMEISEGWIGAFREALNKDVFADYDNNNEISILEAYRYSTNYVIKWYENIHPLIDDDGDKKGSFYLDENNDYDPITGLPICGSDGFLAAYTTLGFRKAPFKPEKPTGPIKIKKDTEYTYNTTTTDPNGDQLYYWFDWGDNKNSGWIGPYESGDKASAKHIWNEKGNYDIRVKARDNHGHESEWSDSLKISFQKENNDNKKPKCNKLLLRFLQSNPNIFSILKKHLGL